MYWASFDYQSVNCFAPVRLQLTTFLSLKPYQFPPRSEVSRLVVSAHHKLHTAHTCLEPKNTRNQTQYWQPNPSQSERIKKTIRLNSSHINQPLAPTAPHCTCTQFIIRIHACNFKNILHLHPEGAWITWALNLLHSPELHSYFHWTNYFHLLYLTIHRVKLFLLVRSKHKIHQDFFRV
jgi:hypothetical protein